MAGALSNIKLTTHSALVRSIMSYACPWESAVDTDLLKRQRLQNRIIRNIGNFPRPTYICDWHKSFQLSCVYDYITELCKQ
jgi:hypothetical protein